MMKTLLLLVACIPYVVLSACTTNPSNKRATLVPDTTVEIVLASDVDWQPLNPARGDKSPKAGTLWGDRNGTGPTGFLVQFVDGFSSPPHIHNVTYRGAVINGLIHNDDPSAAKMWMPAGSFWTQPKGEVHITAAKGETNIAYIEIETAPYLVKPAAEAFDSGERPINVDAANLVWLPPGNLPRENTASSTGPQIAYLWGEPQDGSLNGTFVKLPAGFRGHIDANGHSLRAVVIRGQVAYQDSEASTVMLTPGSGMRSMGQALRLITSKSQDDCTLYIRASGQVQIAPAF